MNRVPDLHNFWRWWSVQLGLLAGACGASATAYAGMLLISPKLVEGIPNWFGVALTAGTTGAAFLGVYARRFSQDSLKTDPPTVTAPKDPQA